MSALEPPDAPVVAGDGQVDDGDAPGELLALGLGAAQAAATSAATAKTIEAWRSDFNIGPSPCE